MTKVQCMFGFDDVTDYSMYKEDKGWLWGFSPYTAPNGRLMPGAIVETWNGQIIIVPAERVTILQATYTADYPLPYRV